MDHTEPATTRKRFRGFIYLSLWPTAQDSDSFHRAAVAADYAGACLALAGEPRGEIWAVPPHEGGPLRRFLAGSAPPLSIPMSCVPFRVGPSTACEAEVDRKTARDAVRNVLRAEGGAGWQLWRQRQ